MRCHRFSSSQPLPLHLFSVLVMVAIPVSLSTPELYGNCRNAVFKCGNITAGYPFSGGDREESCGHFGLQLYCNHETTTIEIRGVRYQVLKIDQDRQILRIARDDLMILITNGFCIPDFKYPYSALDSNLFEFVNAPGPGYTNITLFYDCQPWFGFFFCEETGFNTDKNVSMVIGNTPPKGCSAIVTVPILHTSLEGIHNFSLPLEDVLKTGFEVKWKLEDGEACRKCNDTKGTCGFYGRDQPVCYCSFPIPNWEEAKECHDQDKKNLRLPLGLAIAGAAIFGIGLGILILRLRQRRKKIAAQVKSRDLPTPPSSEGPPTSTSTTNLSQRTPSYLTSQSDLEKGSTYFGVHVFSYKELEEATNNFNPSKELGEGGFGTVYYGVLKDGRVVAVKRLYENNFKRVDQYLNEIEILTRIRHPNLVTLYGCTSRRSRELILVYEYIPNGTVADHLHGKLSNSGLLTWHVRLRIAVETANALAYLHETDIIHRDVKTNNILLDKNFHVKVADFGLSRLFPTDVTHVSTAPQGTPGYVDPEYYQCYRLTEKSDVYSFGVVLIELISAKQAVDTNRHRHDINLANMAVSRIQNHALHELVDPSLGFESDYAVKRMMTAVAELAFRCLQQERDLRPSMEEVLETLRGIQDEELGVQKAEVVGIRSNAEVIDIRSDDVGLLKHIPPPLSPDAVTDKWLQVKSV